MMPFYEGVATRHDCALVEGSLEGTMTQYEFNQVNDIEPANRANEQAELKEGSR